MRKTRLFLFLTILLCSSKAFADGFTADNEGKTIAYNITSSTSPCTVEVTSGGTYTGDITIPASVEYGGTTYAVTAIGESAFYKISKLTSVNIPSSVTSIGAYAFEYCIGLTSVTIPNSVTSIGKYAFGYCSDLASVAIGNSVTSIGGGAFSDCTDLTSVNIPSSVTSIGSGAFMNSKCILEITSDITTLFAFSQNVFEANVYKEATVHVPTGMLNKYCANESWGLFLNITETPMATPAFFSVDDVAYHVSSTADLTVAVIRGGFYGGNIQIPSTVTNDDKTYSVTSIAGYAFENDNLNSIIIPEGVTSIGNFAFHHCNYLTSVTMPNSVVSIGDFAFENCLKLSEINIPSGITTIGEGTFMLCTDLYEINIPSSVTEIRQYAFASTALCSITIPSSVISIGTQAFSNCQSLYTVNFLVEDPATVVASGTTPFLINSYPATLNIPFGTTSAYANAIKPSWGFTKVQERAVITIPASGYVTYCSTGALDFTTAKPADLTAYVASSYTSTGAEAGRLTVTAHNKLPAYTGMLLKGTPGMTYIIPEYAGTTDEVGTNKFVGTNEITKVGTTTIKDGVTYTNLILTTEGEVTSFNLFGADGTIPAHEAYLVLPQSDYEAAGAKKITINFENGGTSDIKTVELNGDLENTIYNLEGQRVQNPEHGIYIVKGKKTYIK